MSAVSVICESMAKWGYGWEDVFVLLKRRNLADDRDAQFIRRFVLRLNAVTRRYGT